MLEERFPPAVFTTPSPHVLRVAVSPGFIQYGGANGPHDDAEDEEADGEDSVVDSGFLGSSMTATEVGKDDAERHGEGDAGDTKQGYLRPCFLCWGPGWRFASGRERFRGIEYGEGGGDQGENNKTAAEIDAAEGHFGHSDSGFDFLYQRKLCCCASPAFEDRLPNLVHFVFQYSPLPSLELALLETSD